MYGELLAPILLKPTLHVEGILVKALDHCRWENMKKLIEPKFFWELSNIEDIFFFTYH